MSDPGAMEGPHTDRAGVDKPALESEVLDAEVVGVGDLDDRERRLLIHFKRELMQVHRREIGDPYGGLPAPDVLERLKRTFPDEDVLDRMLKRLDVEQQHRQRLDVETQSIQRYEAETTRLDADGDRFLQRNEGRRAERVFYVITAVGTGLTLTGHTEVGLIAFGTTAVAVIGSFLKRSFSGRSR